MNDTKKNSNLLYPTMVVIVGIIIIGAIIIFVPGDSVTALTLLVGFITFGVTQIMVNINAKASRDAAEEARKEARAANEQSTTTYHMVNSKLKLVLDSVEFAAEARGFVLGQNAANTRTDKLQEAMAITTANSVEKILKNTGELKEEMVKNEENRQKLKKELAAREAAKKKKSAE